MDNARRISWRRQMPVKLAYELGADGVPIKWWHNGRLLNIVHRQNDESWPDTWWRVLNSGIIALLSIVKKQVYSNYYHFVRFLTT